jgi:hypothetical protein
MRSSANLGFPIELAMLVSTYTPASAEANFRPPPLLHAEPFVGINDLLADSERIHIVILTSTDLQPRLRHDDPLISTLHTEHTMDSGSTTDPVIPLPGETSSKPPPNTSETLFYETVPKKVSVANTSQRRMKEPRSHHKRIPIGRPPGHVAPLGRQVGQRKKDVPAPPSVEINFAKKGGGLSKHAGTASSEELLDVDPGEPTIPELVTSIDSDVSHQAIEENDPISMERYLPNETNFYFSDSLQVPAQDVPTGDTEHNHLIQDSDLGDVSVIPITYKMVWDPFGPQSQPPGLKKDTATTHQPCSSPVSSTHPTRFNASSSTESNIHHHAPASLSSSSMIPNDDPSVPNFQIASHTLMNTPRGRDLARLEDCLSEDIPIRAVLQGWDSIGERWELPPFWQTI